MSEINILDDNTINKIAAGEVVERPASVVKELVENSIDSGASAITVEIKDGGISLIRVTDNGNGIEKDQIKKAFMRHATSKIKDVTDLYRISSLGFRGEALSSICAVSEVELFTKCATDFSGARYCISGGKEKAFEDAGVPCGTTIIVRNLFYNTPARRKFLKSPNTEAGHITELIEKLILSHPEIAFKYMINGIDKIVSPGNRDILSAVYSVFGRSCANMMLPILSETDSCKITGFIGKPEFSRGNRNFELFYVNKRIIKCKIISEAVEKAYSNHLMLHRYPFVIMYFDIDPKRLDINVHPSKTEIKFLDEAILYGAIENAIEAELSKRELIPSVFAAEKSIAESKTEQKTEEPKKEVKKKEISPEPFESSRRQQAESKSEYSFSVESDMNSRVIKDTKDIKKTESVKSDGFPTQMELFEDKFISAQSRINHRIIGQIFDTYWLVEYNDSLYIIDQHAAHEKVLYEKIKKQIQGGKASSQLLSPPIVLSLSKSEERILEDYAENLQKVGFEWEHFGGSEYSIHAVPTELFGLTERDYFIDVLDDLAEGKSKHPDHINDRIASMACKAAIKGNMNLSYKEASALIDELLLLENPYNCPHGRPCIISYSKQEMEKLFKRIV